MDSFSAEINKQTLLTETCDVQLTVLLLLADYLLFIVQSLFLSL